MRPPKARELERAMVGGGGAGFASDDVELNSGVDCGDADGGGEAAVFEGEDGDEGFDGSGGSDGVAVEGFWWS